MIGYTETDEAFIRANYITTPYPVLARQLGKRTTALAAKIIRMGLASKREATRPEKTTHSYRCYTSWASMIQRCTNPKATFWHRYGGRGISVCDRWLDGFGNFLLDMGERPAGFSIDRINPDGNYEPGNCRWIANPEQAKTTWRYLNAKPCFVCNERRTKCGGRCGRCSQYYRRCGIERPNVVYSASTGNALHQMSPEDKAVEERQDARDEARHRCGFAGEPGDTSQPEENT